jgi:hypothetical protein
MVSAVVLLVLQCKSRNSNIAVPTDSTLLHAVDESMQLEDSNHVIRMYLVADQTRVAFRCSLTSQPSGSRTSLMLERDRRSTRPSRRCVVAQLQSRAVPHRMPLAVGSGAVPRARAGDVALEDDHAPVLALDVTDPARAPRGRDTRGR